MAKAPRIGSRTSWKWGNETCYGTVTRVTNKHVFARTKNGKIKRKVRVHK